MVQPALLVVVGTTLLVICKLIYDHIVRLYWFLKDVPGPPFEAAVAGHMRLIASADPGDLHQEWHNKYGPVVAYDGFLNVGKFASWPSPILI